ncbi:peptidase M43B family protein [Pleurotus pulmonarius]|nr:hypothetical protein EYR36_006430 [Pleurotus pulmonarius]KAF4601131.1 hypothetical protein EYR38_005781 [Pleurotus pulmonarius]
MICSAILALAFGIASVAGGPSIPRGRNCGTYIDDQTVVAKEMAFKLHQVAPGSLSPLSASSPKLNVYWHVISKDDTLEGGNVPDSQIAAQIGVLNSAYSSTGLSWVLANTTRTVNAEWFESAGPETSIQADMKAALRQGGPADFNVWTVGFQKGKAKGLLGYATFPSSYEAEPEDDGVVLLYSTVPEGTTPGYNKGHTLTHEAGHWAGLYHTFQGGCGPIGDGIADTKSEKIPSAGCPVGRKTCAGEGTDPINNFMDYSDDECLTEFTRGQIERIQSQMRTYRRVSFAGETGGSARL